MITIRGAGLAGLTTALVLLRRGAAVTLYDRAERIGAASVARAVPVKPLLDQGFKGAELGEALGAARLDALSIYCRKYSQ